MFLKGTGRSLQLNASAAGDLHTHASFSDQDSAGFGTSTEFVHDSEQHAITASGNTTIVAAPSASTKTRTIKRLVIRNRSVTVSNTVVLTVLDSGSDPDAELDSVLLLPGEKVIWREGMMVHYDSRGAIYSVATTGVDPRTNDFRLSGVSATPVMTADSTSLSTVYLAQYKGNRIALYDGTVWQLCTPASEVSLAVTGRTTDLPFDVFAFLSSGVVTLEFLDWTNATTRATGLTRVDGVWTKTGASTRRYLGSIRARSATAFHWVRAGDDLPCKFDLWNVDNRVEASFVLRSLTNTWTYTTATWRQAQGSTNYQVDIMVGLQEETFTAQLVTTSTNATTTIPREAGIGFDTTTALTGLTGSSTNEAAVASQQVALGFLKHQPAIGRHFYSWNEISTATGTTTWYGDNGALRIQSGMSGCWEC